MEQKRINGCIFKDTPKECSSITPDGKCLGLNKLHCLFSHLHLVVEEDAKDELITLLGEEINSPRRFKHLSGQSGRLKGK